jgi:hypothetical protein
MPISSARLARLRSRAATYLTDTCKIEYPTYTSDGMGGQSVSWTTRYAAAACYLASASAVDVGNTGISGNRIETFTAYMLYLAAGSTIAPGDRVTIDSRVYRVEAVVESETARATLQAALTLED